VQKAVTTCGGCGCGPVCGDKQCGYDGCYGTCGDCAANEICLDGWCKSLGLKWISLPGGTYQMGCSPGDAACSSHELPAHNVTVFGFDILETEVTAAQYDAVMIGKVDVPAPSCDAGGGPFAPVECVTWEEAKAFCQAVDPKGRLCTEAEWEYAARGETTTKYYCGDTAACLDDIAWFKTNSGDHKHDVKSGSKQPNSFGLYDMLGNVWEWTADCWHEDYDANDDGIGDWTAGYPEWSSDCSGNVRVKRGCSFLNDELNCRVSSRNYDSPNNYFGSLGVRCCRDQ
jgi:formylglycine-generating enzyme required for sulfatase activity